MKEKKHRESDAYLDNYTGERNFPVPKGLLGYTGKVPNFSTKVMAELWLLQLMHGFGDQPSGQAWYGKALIDEIRRRTRIPNVFPGYEPSEGVVFGLLGKWAKEGLIEEVDEPEKGERLPNPPKKYRITEKGVEHLKEIKAQHHHHIVAGAMLFNRLHADLYGRDLLTQPVTIEQVRYVQPGETLPPLEAMHFEELTDEEETPG